MVSSSRAARMRAIERGLSSGVSRARRHARAAYRASDVGKLQREFERYFRGAGSQQRAQDLLRRVEQFGGAGLAREIQAAGGVERYAIDKSVQTALGLLFRALGPLGEVFRTVMNVQRKTSSLQRQFESAKSFLEAFGYTVIPPRAKQPAKLREALDAMAAEGLGKAEPKKPRREKEAEKPPEYGPELRPGQIFAPPTPEEISAFGVEEKTPDSSNVYSYSFQPHDRHYGTLYVTFRPWWPGMREQRPNARGPLYAYFNVPYSIAESFRRSASSSAGGAVWNYLRQRGTLSGHKYDYRLVQGAVIPTFGKLVAGEPMPGVPGGVYIPRKITPLGFVRRRGFRGFSLEDRMFQVNRGQPDRGTPNRGRPRRET